MKKNIFYNFKFYLILAAIIAMAALLTYSGKKSDSVLAAGQSDAIAVRVIPNPHHYSAQRWYREQGFQGSPQLLIIDGYDAIRDGRTIYVNAGNISGDTLYTNIYIISYNQDADSATMKILDQITMHWKFNANWPEATDPKCSGNAAKNCLIDSDCEGAGFCTSIKAKIIRDVKRLAQTQEIREKIESYSEKNGYYPVLSSGTYIRYATISTWPSWSSSFSQLIGIKAPIDPINKLKDCPGFKDKQTCWDENASNFAFKNDLIKTNIDDSALPGSSVYFYISDAAGSKYKYCANSETGYAISGDQNFCRSGICTRLDSPDFQCGTDNCGGSYGKCQSNEACFNHKCYVNCVTAPGCKASLANATQIGGYCGSGLKCYVCNPGYGWNGSECITSVVPTPTCSPDGCNGHCPSNCVSAAQDPDCGGAGCAGDNVCNISNECSSGGNGDCKVADCCGSVHPACDSGAGENSLTCSSDCQAASTENECNFPFDFSCIFK